MRIRQTIVAAALAFVVLGVSAANASPVLVGTTTFGGETFQAWNAGSGGITWNAASSFAASNSLALATLDTAGENSAVYSLVSSLGLFNTVGLGPWIGGIQHSATDPFVWSQTGVAFGSFETSNFNTASSGQPDAAEGYPNAVLFYPNNGKWGDYGAQCGAGLCGAGNVLGFVTEANTAVPEPVTLSLFGAGLAGAAALRRRRKKVA
jgi:hypothetical protein